MIRARFGVYWSLPARKFETARPVDAVVDDIIMHVRPADWTSYPGDR